MRKVISLLLAIAMVMSMAAVAFAAEASSFTDVAETAYYYDSVNWAVENGVTSGTGEGKFSPSKACTRAEIVTFLWNYAGKPEPTVETNNFTDVSSSDWFYNAVLWAVENGVTSGTGDGTTFSPALECTRDQIVTFLYKYAGNPELSDTENPFSDVASGAWYENAVLWAVEMGITTGTSTTTFSPSMECDRGQIVTFLYRFAMRSNPTNLGAYVDSGVDITITNGITQLFSGNLARVTMTIKNVPEKVVLTYKGDAYEADANGTISITFPANIGPKNPAEFLIKNGTAEDVTLSFAFATPLGDTMNPAQLVIGNNSAPIQKGDTDGYFFTWIATGDGTLTISMQDANWTYSLSNLTASLYGEVYNSADNKENASSSVEVSEGDEIRVNVSTYNPDDVYVAPAGVVSFTAAFDGEGGEETTNPTDPQVPTDPSEPEETTKPTEPEPTEPEPTEPKPTEPKPTEPKPTEPKPTEPEPTEPEPTDPPVVDSGLKVGDNQVVNSGSETVFDFTPSQTGKYLITSPSATKVSVYSNYPFGEVTDSTNTVTWECKSVGQTAQIVVSGVSGQFILNIKRTGNAEEIVMREYVDYVNKHKFPAGFSSAPSGRTFVDVNKAQTVVVGSDGYYHLGSESGPVLYVYFNDSEQKLADLTAAYFLKAVYTDDYGTEHAYDFKSALSEYISAAKSSGYYYPLTQDLEIFLKAYGECQGWFSPSLSPFTEVKNNKFVEDSAWLILCCYEN